MLKEVILMIILTGGEGKPVDASFIEVESATECEERAASAKAVFPQAGLHYVGHYCATSKIKFDDFLHNPEPTGPQYTFDLTFSEDRKKLLTAKSHKSFKQCQADGGKNCVIAYQDVKH